MGAGAGLLAAARGLDEALGRTGLVLSLLKVQFVLKPVAPDRDIHIFGRILGRAGAQSVEAQGKLIVFPFIVLIFTARIQLAEDQFPVVALLIWVPLNRDAAAHVLHFDGAIGVAGQCNLAAIAFAGLIDGIR